MRPVALNEFDTADVKRVMNINEYSYRAITSAWLSKIREPVVSNFDTKENLFLKF